MNHEQHTAWMKDFGDQPKIWWIECPCEGTFEPTGNYYESKEAATFEFNLLVLKKRHPQFRCSTVHSIELAKRRWTT